MTYDVEIKELPAQPAAIVRFTAHVSEMGEHLGRAFGATLHHIQASGTGVAGSPFAYFEQLGDERFDVRAGFPVQTPVQGEGDVQPFELPGGLVATTLHVGPYSKLPEAYEAMKQQEERLGVEMDMSVPMWEEYLSDSDVPPAETRTVVYWPVKKR